MATASKAQTRNSASAKRDDGAGAMIRSLMESPLFREVLANALVAAAGAAAATLIRHRPDSAERVSKVAAAASALKGSPSRRDVTEFGRQAVRDLVSQVGREVIPGLVSAVSGGDTDRSRPKDTNGGSSSRNGQGQDTRKSAAAQWR